MSTPRAENRRIFDALSSTFGFSSFRPLQKEVVQTILRGHDVFVLMPTGGGKSLCYQLPAVLLDGLTVVVSPLISLMKDQVDALHALGVPATYINSSLTAAEVRRREQSILAREIKLLYVAPERLMMPAFLDTLKTVSVSLMVIDEAHCISEWGHDFRPEYRDLKRMRRLFPDAALGAFTATATRRVAEDITSQLAIGGAARFQGSFNRANLFYEVRPKKGAYHDLVAYLRNKPHESGIVYCGSRAGTEDLAERLRSDGFHAAAYHAGLTPEERSQRHEAFMRDDVPIVAATVAFGMGIDKPDVRFVVHYDLPRTLENYYQESGRAGRDGEPSDAILYYSAGDVVKLRRFAEEGGTEAERRIALWQLQHMASWAESAVCRRRALLAYFGETFEGQDAACCDLCRDPGVEEDVTVPAQMLLSCVKRTGERFGVTHVIDVLRGSRSERVLRLGHDTLPTHGVGSGRSIDEWRDIARHLIGSGYLYQDPDAFNILKVTPRGRAILFEGERVMRRVRRPPAGTVPTSPVHSHPALFERLRALRKELADARSIPPYVIFHDSTLRSMASRLPFSREELKRVPGVGERKLADYGDAFLEVVSAFVAETGAVPEVAPSPPAPRARTRERIGDTVRRTAQMFRDGLSMEEIATQRNLVLTTIEGHLAEAVEAGEEVAIERVVAVDDQRVIEEAFRVVGSSGLKQVMEQLNNRYSYGQLRLMQAAMRRAAMPVREGDATSPPVPTN